jgi:DNA replication protein DnaC
LPKNSGEHLFEVIMRRYENRSTIMTSNRPLEEWGKLLGDVPTAGAISDRSLRHAQTIAITGRSYRLKDLATIAGKEDKNRKIKATPDEPSTAEPAS